MNPFKTKSETSPKCQKFIELLQSINFGRVFNVHIKNGEPILTNSTVVEREIKFNGHNGPRQELELKDFLLKQELVEFFDTLQSVNEGFINQIEIKHGLPFLMRIQERLEF